MTALAHNYSAAPGATYPFGPDYSGQPSLRIAAYADNLGSASRWQAIAGRIVAWEYDPTVAGDMTPPTADARNMAVQFCDAFADQGAPEPSRAIPTGDGGIIFEWEFPAYYLSVEVNADGGWERIVYQDGKIIDRTRP